MGVASLGAVTENPCELGDGEGLASSHAILSNIPGVAPRSGPVGAARASATSPNTPAWQAYAPMSSTSPSWARAGRISATSSVPGRGRGGGTRDGRATAAHGRRGALAETRPSFLCRHGRSQALTRPFPRRAGTPDSRRGRTGCHYGLDAPPNGCPCILASILELSSSTLLPLGGARGASADQG